MFSHGPHNVVSSFPAAGLTGRWRDLSPASPAFFQFRALLGRAMRWIVGRRLNSEQVNVNLHCIARYVIRPSGIIVCRSVKVSAVLRLFDDDTQDFAKLKKHGCRSFPWINGNTEGTVGCAEKVSIRSVK